MRHLTAALAATTTLVTAAAALTAPALAGTAALTPAPSSPSPALPSPASEPPSSASVKVRPGTSKGTGALTPIAGADRLVAPLGVDPACPARIDIGLRSDAKKAGYATAAIEVDKPLTASRAMLTSYLPPGYELSAKLLVAVPPGTAEGTYGLRLRTTTKRSLEVPVEVMTVDRLDNGGNFALRRPVTASSQHTNANYPPCSVADGDRSSNGWAGGNGWNDATARAFPDTVAIALGGARQISRVDLYTLDTERYPAYRYGVRDWDVQAQVGGQWQTVAQVRGNTAGTVRSDFAPVTADAVRVVALASNGANDYTRIIEVEVR
ncbi:discoidin domain-containing protein [Nonomuraea wenchangensis]|uniref:F5/8 type C domain-containing protein n=1 Tax=Nonomuraea wenchangensis TaxID=568860 RepID=A0A1I0KM99_9ACTN|nr:discoidin domain-containing protein [Nonomuraea wenchangensis]SEU26096.1 F5/8 type C domain-containing protein [Nonomuraea wenchangensis]